MVILFIIRKGNIIHHKDKESYYILSEINGYISYEGKISILFIRGNDYIIFDGKTILFNGEMTKAAIFLANGV